MLGKLEKLTEKEPAELGEEAQKAEEGLACCSDMGWIPLLPTFCPNILRVLLSNLHLFF